MKDSILHIRINKELLERLRTIALIENRTLSNLVETILKDYLKEKSK